MMAPVRITGVSQEERMRLGGKVRDYRTARGIKQADLADAADVSLKTISNIENGRGVPQEDVLRRIYRVLGVATDTDEHDEEIENALSIFAGLLEATEPEKRYAAVMEATAALTSYVRRSSLDTAANRPPTTPPIADAP